MRDHPTQAAMVGMFGCAMVYAIGHLLGAVISDDLALEDQMLARAWTNAFVTLGSPIEACYNRALESSLTQPGRGVASDQLLLLAMSCDGTLAANAY